MNRAGRPTLRLPGIGEPDRQCRGAEREQDAEITPAGRRICCRRACHSSFLRADTSKSLHLAASLVVLSLSAVPNGQAQHRAEEPQAAAPERLGSFDAWTAVAYGKAGQKVCYAFARAAPDGANRQRATLTVAHWAGGRNHVSLGAGFAFPPARPWKWRWGARNSPSSHGRTPPTRTTAWPRCWRSAAEERRWPAVLPAGAAPPPTPSRCRASVPPTTPSRALAPPDRGPAPARRPRSGGFYPQCRS